MKEVQISTRIEESLRDDLQKMAERGDRTFSQEVRKALRLHVINGKLRRYEEGSA